jgi:hypothetical protein
MYKKSLFILAGLFLLAGCGSGGSSTSGNSGYSGVTTQATITTANARALSADVYSGGQVSVPPVGVAKEATGSAGQSVLLQETAFILQHSVATIIGASKSSAKVSAAVVTTQNTKYGYSGSCSSSITYDQVSGAVNGTITYSQYKETSTSSTLSGSIDYYGTFGAYGIYNQDAGSLFTSLNMNLHNLTIINGSSSHSMTGSEAYSNSGTEETVTMSAVVTDNVSGRTYWEKDYKLTISGGSLTLSGTHYDPVYGYVVFSTITPITVTAIDATPTSGQLLFSGSNGTKVRLTFFSGGRNSGGGSPTVEADTTGDGTYVVIP